MDKLRARTPGARAVSSGRRRLRRRRRISSARRSSPRSHTPIRSVRRPTLAEIMHPSPAPFDSAQGRLAHQFDNLEQQKEASTLGMWVFLTTEVLFFGGLFVTYGVYRLWSPAAFAAGSREMLIWAGATNTAVLITSSLTMALAVHAAQTGNRRALMSFLVLTMLLGCVFLGIKAFEYHTELAEHHVPGAAFEVQHQGAARQQGVALLCLFH